MAALCSVAAHLLVMACLERAPRPLSLGSHLAPTAASRPFEARLTSSTATSLATERKTAPASELTDSRTAAVTPPESTAAQPSAELPSDYWPRKLLDEGPTPLEPIVVPYPEGLTQPPQGRVILQLFINASGRVDRVEMMESDAPPEFVALAQETFSGARFHPGFKDNVNVPSRIKIEVGFDQGTPSP